MSAIQTGNRGATMERHLLLSFTLTIQVREIRQKAHRGVRLIYTFDERCPELNLMTSVCHSIRISFMKRQCLDGSRRSWPRLERTRLLTSLKLNCKSSNGFVFCLFLSIFKAYDARIRSSTSIKQRVLKIKPSKRTYYARQKLPNAVPPNDLLRRQRERPGESRSLRRMLRKTRKKHLLSMRRRLRKKKWHLHYGRRQPQERHHQEEEEEGRKL